MARTLFEIRLNTAAQVNFVDESRGFGAQEKLVWKMILVGFVCYLQELWMSTDRRRRPNTVFMLHQRSLLSPLCVWVAFTTFSISLWASLSPSRNPPPPPHMGARHKHLSPYRYRVPFRGGDYHQHWVENAPNLFGWTRSCEPRD